MADSALGCHSMISNDVHAPFLLVRCGHIFSQEDPFDFVGKVYNKQHKGQTTPGAGAYACKDSLIERPTPGSYKVTEKRNNPVFNHIAAHEVCVMELLLPGMP